MTGPAPFDPPRPRTWGECQARGLGTASSPCPYASCKYSLLVDVDRRGTLRELREVDAPGAETCALRVAERGGNAGRGTSDAGASADAPDGVDYGALGAALGVSAARAQQIAEGAMARLARGARRDVTRRCA